MAATTGGAIGTSLSVFARLAVVASVTTHDKVDLLFRPDDDKSLVLRAKRLQAASQVRLFHS
jgi:hypothetical protein